jgi:preprotein translocase subunit SecA
LPDFITNHIDPLSGDDDTGDFDAAAMARMFDTAPPGQAIPATMPDGSPVPEPESRNAPCPCGSGLKYKHCHGQAA